jgi:hypothetical protein
MSQGTISEYTLCSLILLAIRLQYCPPKSSTKIASCFMGYSFIMTFNEDEQLLKASLEQSKTVLTVFWLKELFVV